jgi:hypothetical protein
MSRKQYGILFDPKKIGAIDDAIKDGKDRTRWIEEAMDEKMANEGIRIPSPPMPLVTAKELGMSVEEMHIKQRKLYLTCQSYRESVQELPGFEHLWRKSNGNAN